MNDQEYAEYVDMLRKWRFHKAHDGFFQVDNPEYQKWKERFDALRTKANSAQLAAASKEIGWKS